MHTSNNAHSQQLPHLELHILTSHVGLYPNLVHNNLQRHFIFWIQATVLSAPRNGYCIAPMTFFQLRIWNIEEIDFTFTIALLECRNDVTVTPPHVSWSKPHMAIDKSSQTLSVSFTLAGVLAL